MRLRIFHVSDIYIYHNFFLSIISIPILKYENLISHLKKNGYEIQ